MTREEIAERTAKKLGLDIDKNGSWRYSFAGYHLFLPARVQHALIDAKVELAERDNRAINEELADLRSRWNAAEERVKELREALQVIADALHDDKGSYHPARAFLDKHGRYHGNLEGERVLLEVAEVALLTEGARAVLSEEGNP